MNIRTLKSINTNIQYELNDLNLSKDKKTKLINK